MTIETLQQLLRDYGLKANKTYGQNFLMDEIVLQDMVSAAKVTQDDFVIEVGPGIGNLTKFLLETGANVVSIEKDPQFVPVLNSLKKQYKNFDYILGDVLEVELDKIISKKDNYKVVANIPYYVTGKIIQKFLSVLHKPVSMTVLIQKEVGENLTAKVGKLNLLAISVQLYADVELLEVVPARKFFPAPKVDSSVVNILLHKKPKHVVVDQKRFYKILHACFSGKRKQIHNTLTNNLGLEKDFVFQILSQLKLSPELRPQQLSIDDWIKLVEKISQD